MPRVPRADAVSSLLAGAAAVAGAAALLRDVVLVDVERPGPAGKGSLDITDGQTMQTIPLTPEDLARGSFTYMPTGADVQVRMEIQSASRGNVVEQTRFLGAPASGGSAAAAAGGDVQAVKQERDSLQEEVKKLRDQNAAQVDRNRQLERTLTILRSRLGIVDSDNKK